MKMKHNFPEAPPLTAEAFDHLFKRRDMIWGLTTIAGVFGVSVDKVRKWHRETDAPIFCPDGSYWCSRSEMVAWLRRKS
ncbi:DNA-binding protein [Thioclava sp. GXIMD4215]|uniref:DNA-binding protein n=1 Tax=Thioclava sp. GXIMD4215 TaxID=3131928 RepID=UPI003249A282